MNDFFEAINKNDENFDIRTYSPLTLAYIGDSIFEICARTHITKLANTKPKNLHNKVKNFVNANSQSIMYKNISPFLLEEEVSILKRGRNANSNSFPRNSSISDYKNATGLEALFGYLYLTKNYSRILEIFNMCINCLDESK